MRLSLLLAVVASLSSCRATAPRAGRGVAGGQLSEGRTFLKSSGAWTVSVPGDARELDLASARLEVGHFVRHGLSVGGELGVHAIDSDASGSGAADTHGASASTLLRWHAFEGRGWSAFMELGVGLLATDDSFPAGGTRWNGLRQAGVGLELELTSQLRLAAGVRQQHVSNGKGLVADNPAWDGQGAYLGLHFDLTPQAAPRRAARTMTLPPAEPWSLRLEARGGEYGGDDRGGGGVFALDTQVYGPLFAQVRGSLDSVEQEALGEYGAALYVRGETGRVGVAYDRQELDVFSDDEFSLFGEWLASDITTVASVVGREFRSHSEDRSFAGVLLRIYVLDGLAVDSGIAARAASDEIGSDAVLVPLGFEYAFAPALLPGLSLFAQNDLHDDSRVVGLRWTYSPGLTASRSLRERDFSNGPLRLRP